MKNRFSIFFIFFLISLAVIFNGCEPPEPAQWPDAPKRINSFRSPEGSETIKITWEEVIDAYSYNIYYSNSNAPDSFEFDGSTQTTEFTSYDNYLTSEWYFKITAVNIEGEEGNLSSWTYVPPWGEPAGVTAARDSAEPESVIIKWNRVSGAASYNVYYSEIGGNDEGAKDNKSPITGTSYSSYGNTIDKSWYFYVTAVNSDGKEGIPSKWASVSSVETNPFLGTWRGRDNDNFLIELTFTESTWRLSSPNNEFDTSSGTYTRRGDIASLKYSDGDSKGTVSFIEGKLWVEEIGYDPYWLSRDSGR